eukprot:1188419-Prorocentrum_minimum.AAC.2
MRASSGPSPPPPSAAIGPLVDRLGIPDVDRDAPALAARDPPGPPREDSPPRLAVCGRGPGIPAGASAAATEREERPILASSGSASFWSRAGREETARAVASGPYTANMRSSSLAPASRTWV